jgi:hypothetical protein
MNSRIRRDFVLRAAAKVLGVWGLIVVAIAGMLYVLSGIGGARIVNTASHTSVVGLLEFTYFAIVTTTTLGYGDYVPEGWFRILAGFDALVGVVMTGVLVARITAELVDPLSLLRTVQGPWFDHVRITCIDGTVTEFVSLYEVEKQGNRWVCSGRNFEMSGTYRHRFDAHIVGVEGSTLYIPYHNDASASNDYTSGIWVITLSGSADPQWFSSYCHDLKYGRRDESIGIKLRPIKDKEILDGLKAEAGADQFCRAIDLGLQRTRRIKPSKGSTPLPT